MAMATNLSVRVQGMVSCALSTVGISVPPQTITGIRLHFSAQDQRGTLERIEIASSHPGHNNIIVNNTAGDRQVLINNTPRPNVSPDQGAILVDGLHEVGIEAGEVSGARGNPKRPRGEITCAEPSV